MQTAGNITLPQIYQRTKNGYLIMAESKVPTARPASKWKFRLFSDLISPMMGDKETISIKPTIQEVEDVFHPNKHNILFRSMIKVKDAQITNASFHVSFLPNVMISITLFDNDLEIATSRGKGSAAIRAVFMHLVEETKLAETKKGAATTPAGVPAQITSTILPAKHKYVLQAKIEASEKFNTIAPEQTRPNSRGAKPGSGRSKKNIISGKQGTPNQEESKWKLRLISTEPVTKDTEKEDLFKAIKDGWETSQPGRIQTARDCRDSYIKLLEAGQILPVFIPGVLESKNIKPWTIVKQNAPRVQLSSEKIKRDINIETTTISNLEANSIMNDIKEPTKDSFVKEAILTTNPALISKDSKDLKEKAVLIQDSCKEIKEKDEGAIMYKSSILQTFERSEIMPQDHVQTSIAEQMQQIEAASKMFQELKQAKISYKEARLNEKRLQLELVDIKMREIDAWIKHDLHNRDLYRQRLVREAEELHAKLQAIQEAKAAQDAQENTTGEESGRSRKGRK